MSYSPRLRAACGLFLAYCLGTSASAAPFINEIMFRPAGLPENPSHEFIDLHNPDEAAVNLTGWRFDQGVTFTFPAVSIPAGGYLVVASKLAPFQAKYPGVTNVVGGWSGSLSNSAEGVRLVNALGETVDSVDYATQGDWGQRVREAQFNGWDWRSLADGGGRSLELINPLLGNNSGQNWGPSTPNDGTPGQANSVASANIAPLIKDVRHRPTVPTSNEPITIGCDLEDELPTAATANLFWRVSSANPPAFTSTPMAPDAQGRFKAVLPSHADKTIIEFYIEASDGTMIRTWPAPTNEGQNANALLQVDNEVLPAGQCSVRLILTVQENNAYQNSNSGSDREYNTTILGDFGSGQSIRYRAGMRIRGASSRTWNPRPMRIAITNDDKLAGAAVFNLNPKFTYLQYLGAKLFQAAGIRAPDTRPVQVRRNGVNNARNDDVDFGRWAMVEHLDGDFVDNHWPNDADGNLYKKVRPDTSWAYRSGNVQQYLNDGFTKETNTSANDWSDLDSFMQVINANPASSDYLPDIQVIADIPQWMRWFALENLIANGETNVSNGADDDYSFYRGTIGQRFQLVPHDLDTILGWGDQDRIEDPNYTLFDMTEQGDRGEILDPLVPFFGTTTGGGLATIRQGYFTALRDLASTLFEPVAFGQFVDNHLSGWVGQSRIDAIKSFMSARRTFVLNTVVPAVGAYVPQVPTSIGTLAAPRTTPVVINEVLAHNVAGYLADGAYPDVLELHNYGASAVDLSGKVLTDDPTDRTKFVFGPGTSIPAGGFMVLLGGTAPLGGTGTYLNFSLSREGGAVYFYEPTDTGLVIDSVAFGPQAPDFSIGRTGTAGDLWGLGTRSLGSANTTQPTGDVAQVLLNEWLANPDFRVRNDFIEIYNPLTTPVALGGVRITDDFINYPTRHTLPALSYIGGRGFAVFSLRGNAASAAQPSDLPFKLNALGGWAAILGNNGVAIDRVDMDCQARDVSRGRAPDGGATLALFAIPTPGLPNTDPPATLNALLNDLRITELNYNPLGFGTPAQNGSYEFIELYNIGSAPLDLTGVRLSEGIQFVFPSYTLAPGAYVVVVRNLLAFEERYGPGRPVAGVFAGALDNSGETISLTLPNPWDVNILSFRYERDWYPWTDGGGFTLEITSASSLPPREWSDRDSWVAGVLIDGTPGAPSPPVIISPLTANGTVGALFTYTVLATNDPAAFSAAGLPGGLAINTSTGVISGIPTAFGTFNVAIGANNSGGQDQRTLALTVAAQPPPAITSALTVSGLIGGTFTYQIVAANNPTSYSATGRPAWMNVNAATGLLSGTPTAAGTFNVTIEASNDVGTDTETLVVQIVADEIAAAVDTGELTFTRGGNVNWFSQTDNAYDGVDAAASGDIGNNQQSWTESTIAGPRSISFWWSVSSRGFNEEFNDSLDFLVDGTRVARIWGDVAWQEEKFQLPAGTHTLRWVYRKDGFGSGGADMGWLDRVALGDPDTDADGLSDPWELANFGNLSRDGTGDFDSDGHNDGDEYAAGTNPTNPDSHFSLRSIEPNGDQFTISWDAVTGRTYQCQTSPDLRSWFDIGAPIIANGPIASTITTPPKSAEEELILVGEPAPAKALVPTSDIGALWQGGNEAAFLAAGGDAAWLSGNTGIGYDLNPTPVNYLPFVGTALPLNAQNQLSNTSVFIRVRFNIEDPALFTGLALRMRVDDGFAAWINGQPLPASQLAPSPLAWNSAATQSASDQAAIIFQDFDLPGPFDYLRTGENILAIQGLNQQQMSSDLLIQPVLVGRVPVEFSSSHAFWRVVALP
ncbi:MAG: lamin tail domain-containing protein [Verrucomicrobiales bacterium]